MAEVKCKNSSYIKNLVWRMAEVGYKKSSNIKSLVWRMAEVGCENSAGSGELFKKFSLRNSFQCETFI